MIKISTCPKTAPSLLVFESVDFREEAGSTESEISWSLLCGGGFSGIAGWTPSMASQCARILGAYLDNDYISSGSAGCTPSITSQCALILRAQVDKDNVY